MNEAIVVETTDDLVSLMDKGDSIFKPARKVTLSLQIPSLNSGDRARYEGELTRLYCECGCLWGGVSGFLGLVAYLAGFLILDLRFDWFVIPFAIVLVAVCAAAGKIAGVAIARIRLQLLISELVSLYG